MMEKDVDGCDDSGAFELVSLPETTKEVHERQLKREYRARLYAKRKLNPATPPAQKKCPVCDTVKESGEFYRDTSRRDGLQRFCKTCNDEYNKSVSLKWWNKSIFWFARNRAKRDGREFSITIKTIDRLWEQQQGRCHWYGVPMIPSGEKYDPRKPSLDRLDISRGYTEDNVVLSCLAANLGRCGCDPELFKQFADTIKASQRP